MFYNLDFKPLEMYNRNGVRGMASGHLQTAAAGQTVTASLTPVQHVKVQNVTWQCPIGFTLHRVIVLCLGAM